LINFKVSSYIFIIITIFLTIDFIGYKLLYTQMHETHDKDIKILFYQIQTETNDLLLKLMYQYNTKKEELLQKHREAEKYVNLNSSDINLTKIKAIINDGILQAPYDISITNDDLVITDTTFKADMGLDLSFAKDDFKKHYESNTIGVCSPLYETYSKNFMSFTDSFISRNDQNTSGRVLLLYYSYHQNTKKQLQKIRELIGHYPSIKDLKAYTIVDSSFINDFSIKDYRAYKPDSNAIQKRINDGVAINKKLGDKNFMIEDFKENGIPYKIIHASSTNAIFDNTKFIYSILFDESEFHAQIKKLNFSIVFITILGIIAIIIITIIRNKETRLSNQDKFVQSSMHEIKTPLSVITLNNELRELEFGKDEYSSEIDSAIKMLKTSYDDMSFTITKDNLDYPTEIVELSKVIGERVEYFKTIARSNSKSIKLEVNSNCKVRMSLVELIRLIDNNLSNAIKYSKVNTNITIRLEDDMLTFHSIGKPIKDTKRIFNKYFRENSVVGGHGLGLSIVKDIAKKYFIDISLESNAENGTTFTYKFKCHIDDISK